MDLDCGRDLDNWDSITWYVFPLAEDLLVGNRDNNLLLQCQPWKMNIYYLKCIIFEIHAEHRKSTVNTILSLNKYIFFVFFSKFSWTLISFATSNSSFMLPKLISHFPLFIIVFEFNIWNLDLVLTDMRFYYLDPETFDILNFFLLNFWYFNFGTDPEWILDGSDPG